MALEDNNNENEKTQEVKTTTQIPKGTLYGRKVVADFHPDKHFYEKVRNATIHPLVASFLTLGNKRIIKRYCHLNPGVNKAKLTELLQYKAKYFCWSGSDLFNVTTDTGERKMVLVETNSCPSGQKSCPPLHENSEKTGYHSLIEDTFGNLVNLATIKGCLAVVYDKNKMEATGYAAVLKETFKEPVYLARFYKDDKSPPVRWVNGVMEIRIRNEDKVEVEKKEEDEDEDEEEEDEKDFDENESKDVDWIPVRACFRYVTQKPWDRFPIISKTVVLNPVIACLAGGRNKMVAAKAYDLLNADLEMCGSGLRINIPKTIKDVSKQEIPLYIKSLGGHGVVKVPYLNAGQGIFCITNEQDLKDFMDSDFPYDKYIVQSLVGNANWSSMTDHGKFFHVGTLPSKKLKTYCFDLRMMIQNTKDGYRPLAIYSRQARKPLVDDLSKTKSTSWDMLGTNLSIKLGNNEWGSDTSRLLIMDRKDFNKLGLGVDDLIGAYIQTVLASISIDQMARRFINSETQQFDLKLFRSINSDESLIAELFEMKQLKLEVVTPSKDLPDTLGITKKAK